MHHVALYKCLRHFIIHKRLKLNLLYPPSKRKGQSMSAVGGTLTDSGALILTSDQRRGVFEKRLLSQGLEFGGGEEANKSKRARIV